MFQRSPPAAPPTTLSSKPGAWVDLALTLPIFLAYHVGVVFLRTQNATDIVTGPLLHLAEGNRTAYVEITSAMGLAFATVFAVVGRGQAFRMSKFVQTAAEGMLYATGMGTCASYVVGRLFAGNIKTADPFAGVVLSLGAGFYEEIAFRVLLFGVGAKLLIWMVAGQKPVLFGGPTQLSFRAVALAFVWALIAAAIFSGMHYVGGMGDNFVLATFVFRFVLGVALTLIYTVRGFAAAVWSHALYDIWVLVLPH